MLNDRLDHARGSTTRRIRHTLGLKPGRMYTTHPQPYFFTLRDRRAGSRSTGRTRSAQAGSRSTRRSTRACSGGAAGDPRTLAVQDGPGVRRSSRSTRGTGAIRAMAAGDPQNTGNQYNLVAQSARQPGSTFKTFVLASAIARGVDPDSTYYTSAPFTCSIGPWCQRQAVAVDTYDHSYSRLGVDHARNALLRQHDLRATDARRRSALGLQHGAPARRATLAGQAGRVDRARLARRLAARHGHGLRDVRRGGHLFEADGDHEGDPPRGKVDTDAGWGKPQTKRAISEAVA